MPPRPRIICHMTASIDGGLHPSRYSTSPDGEMKDWSRAYEAVHDSLAADGWIVGRVTMAEMAKGTPQPPVTAQAQAPARPVHVAEGATGPFAIALDPSGKLHFAAPDVGGDRVIVLLAHDVRDAHLAALAAGGISYIVAATPDLDLAAMLSVLCERFGVATLLLEGGGGINGTFLAAGLVDELSVIVAPALDGASDAERIVMTADGLKDRVALSFLSATPVDGGAVHLRYAVRPAD